MAKSKEAREHPEVHMVTITVAKPGPRNPAGQVSFGYYTVDGSVMTMTDASGIPMRRTDGELYQHVLGPDENPKSMACVMAKQVRAAVHGYSAFSEPVRGPIEYPDAPPWKGWR